VTVWPIPARHWRSYGDDKLPTGAEAPGEPFTAFPSWFMRIECGRCGKVRMISETHTPQRDIPIRDIIARMRHDGCGGRAGKVELITGIDGTSSQQVRRIVLREFAAKPKLLQTECAARPAGKKLGFAYVASVAR
jgi:hypothetical protein